MAPWAMPRCCTNSRKPVGRGIRSCENSVLETMIDPLSIVKRFVDEYQTTGNEAVVEELLASDFVDHTPFPGFGSSREDVKQLFRVLREAFPDLKAEIVEQFSNGEMVATRKTFHGTHNGRFMGMEPTGPARSAYA